MSPTRPQLASDLFDEAVELPHDRRGAFLEHACGDDVALRREVEALLAADDTAGAFLSDPQFNPAEAVHQIAGADLPGSRIGPYKLVELIGEGGFGTVFLAEQELPVKRRVALKVIKLGMDTRQVIARFSAERQALAMMDHPNIARVLDAGATESGRPFFVMELVRGTPITRYCDQNQLTLAQRIELFVPVCLAVQHAHQKGIIHRDLKPSNILITLIDGKPVPKIIDFGIAKATQQRLTDQTIHTGFYSIGTPMYMSPEQAALSGDDIDTRSDVYSLGVMLYELLTGTTPFDSHSIQNATYAEVQRLIREVDPPRPSTRVWSRRESLGDTPMAGAPAQLRSRLRGELDWVVMKCLEKQRSRRYESAGALAGDLEAHLKGRPVAAAPPSRVYLAKKFVGQHTLAIGIGAGVITALAVGLILALFALQRLRLEQQRTLAEKQRAERSRQEALTANETAHAVNEFVNDMLASADPYQRGKSITVEQLLLEADDTLDQRFAGRPLVEAGVHDTIGRAFAGLGRNQEAVRHLQQSIELRAGNGLIDSPELLTSKAELAVALHILGNFETASKLFTEVVAGARRQLEVSEGSDVVRAVDVLVRSATYINASRTELERLFDRATTRRADVLGVDHPDTLACRSTWAWYLALAADEPARTAPPGAVSSGDESARRDAYARAESILRDTHERLLRVLGAGHRTTVRNADRLQRLLSIQGRRGEAIALARQTADAVEQAVGAEHPLTMQALSDYAELLKRDKQFEAAIDVQRRRLKGMEAIYGPRTAAMAGVLGGIGELYELTGRDDEAIALYRQRLILTREQHGLDSINVAFSEGQLADKLLRRGDHAGAIELMSHALPVLRKNVRPDSTRLADQAGLYARALFAAGQNDEALPYARESFDIAAANFAKAEANLRNHLSRLTAQAAILLARVRGPVEAEAQIRIALEQATVQMRPGETIKQLLTHARDACLQTGRAAEAAEFERRLQDVIATIAASQPATAPAVNTSSARP